MDAHVRFEGQDAKKIKELAAKEIRTPPQMVKVLVIEALRAREVRERQSQQHVAATSR